MRRSALLSSAILLSLQTGCNQKKASSGSSEEPTQDPGQVNVDTNPDEEKVDESKQATGDDVVVDVPTMQMSGKLAIEGTGLDTVAMPDKLLAFPIEGGQLKSVEEILKADVAADGSFSLKIPKEDQMMALLQAVIKGDVVDRQKLKDLVQSMSDAGNLLEMTDAEVLKAIKDEIAQHKDHAVTWVVVSMVSSDKPEGIAKRAEEAATFAYIGLTAGGNNLFNLPVASAKKDLALGTVTIQGDDARSTVDAAADDRFELVGDVLNQLAATGATLKAVKNDYVNTDTKTGQRFHAAPFFAFEGDVADAVDQFSSLDIGHDGDALGYKGYGLYMQGRAKDPSHPTVDLITKNLCADDRRNFELFPPATIPTTRTDDLIYPFDQTHPMGMTQATALEGINGNTRFQCGTEVTSVPDEMYYASGETLTDKELNWNWGSGGGLLEAVPAGAWTLKIEGTDMATFDLAAAQPLTALSATDSVANVFVPQIKITKDGNDLITKVDIKFSYYSGDGFKAVADLTALRRGVQELSLDFDDYSGTREGSRISLDGAPDTSGVFSVDLTTAKDTDTGEVPEPMLFPKNPAWPDADRVADSISVSYKMYGNTYRFDFRVR